MKKTIQIVFLTICALFLNVSIVQAQTQTDVLLNKTVSYSGVEGGKKTDGNWKYPQFVGEKVVDGSTETRWSADKTDYQWLVVDIGESIPISEIYINFHATSPEYSVSISENGTEYSEVYSNNEGSSGTPSDKLIYFNKQNVRYVKYEQHKMWLHSGNKNYYGSSIISLSAFKERTSPDSIEINEKDIKLSVDRSMQLTYKLTPSYLNIAKDELIWTSENSEILEVDSSGKIFGKSAGQTNITVSVKDTNIKDTMEVEVIEKNPEYELMRSRWKDRLIGNNINSQDEDIKNYIESVSNESYQLWETLDKSPSRTYLWEKLSSDTVSADMTTQFSNIKKLTLGYYLPGTRLYNNQEVKDEIIKSIDFMIDEKKYNGTYSTGNWWDWQIGSTHMLVDTLILLHDDLVKDDYEKLVKFVDPINKYAYDPNKQWPNYKASGANLTDISISVLGSAILLENDERLKMVVESVPSVLQQVSKGDGLYSDGSLVQHTFFPYNGSYGNELIKGVGKIQSILVDTNWEIKDDNIDNLYTVIDKGYLQLMYDGKMPSMVSGRSISRAPGKNPFTTELETGKETIANLLLISKFAPEQLNKSIQSTVKSWLEETKDQYNFYENPRDFEALLDLKNVENNSKILPEENKNVTNIYSSMDRAFQKNDSYAVGISMYSNRIANYESINTENKKGWHTSDGMMYLYTKDLNQFDEGYWTTVDPYRLPGTTVDTKPLVDSVNSSKKSPQNWVGGTSINELSSVGMYLDKSNEGMNLKAKKSWFLLDEGIVSMGTGITGNSNATIETIIDNRQINPNDIITSENSEKISDVSKEINGWINIETDNVRNNVGYIIPEPVEVLTEQRIGTYKDINGYFYSDTQYSQKYLKIINNHGMNVENENYEYVTIPGKSSEEIEKLSNQPFYKVLKKNANIHAIKYKNVLLSNSFSENQNIEEDGIDIISPMSLIVEELGDNKFSLTMSNPKQNNEKISLDFLKGIEEIVSADSGYSVEGNLISLDTANLLGESKTIVVKSKTSKEELGETIKLAKEKNKDDYTKESWTNFETVLNEAEKVFVEENASQNDIDAVNKKLKQAMENLTFDIREPIELNVSSLEILKRNKSISLEVKNAKIGEEFEWSVQDTNIAKIEENQLIGKKAGTTRVFVKSSLGRSASFTVRVSN